MEEAEDAAEGGCSNWGELPYVTLAQIFSHLPDRDKYNASLVNRAWSEGFSWPGNWRKREMIFYGSCEETVAREEAFVERFGAQLRCLRLRCWSPAQGPALESYLDHVSGVLRFLSEKATLHEIHVADVEGLGYSDDDLITVNDLLFESERRAEGKAKMGSVFASLIRSQKELRVLDLQEVDCAWDVGLSLVEAAAASPSARSTLHTLLLAGTFNRLPARETASSAGYLLAMASFRKLARLRLDYRCLSCELLDVLGTSLGDCFRVLMILSSEEDGPELPQLEDEAWRCLSSRCPKLRVELTVEGGTRYAGGRKELLKSGMPLSSLSLDGDLQQLRADYWDTKPTLDLLLREFRSTLEHLSMGMGQLTEKVTAEMVERALRLKHLKTLHLSGQVDPESMLALYDLLDQPQGASDLQAFTLTAWCTSEEQIDRLLTANRQAIRKRTCTRVAIRLIPMM